MNSPIAPQPKYFEIFRAVHRGGLSLWLNRKSMLPLTLVPMIVTFITLTMMRLVSDGVSMDGMGGEPSAAFAPSLFMYALMQIPADFVTGIFCALVIFIIMNAPEKGDKDKPVMFTLNIMSRKDLLVKAAIAHTVVAYLMGGLYAAMEMVFVPISNAAEADVAPDPIYMMASFILMGMVVYGIRFLLLPVIMIADIDAKGFFTTFKSIGLSLPVFAVKLITMLAIGIVIMIIRSVLLPNGAEGADVILLGLADLVTAFGNVIATTWAYAALAIGVRFMMKQAGQA